MSAWQVDWTPEASELWLKALNRNSVAAASDRIDALLGNNPHTAGRLLSEGLWKIEFAPLKALYEIDAANSVVTVTAVLWIV
jgi:mRNA-degrading endonuclease RelE of RelBE toxin-antitoxin system